MSWKEVLADDSPVLSSPNAYQVPPTFMMPSPCICNGLPFWSVHAVPGAKVAVAAEAGAARTRAVASPASTETSTPTFRRVRVVVRRLPVGMASSSPRRCRRFRLVFR
jgi:hypothetical protein